MWKFAVAALHQDAPGQMTWLEDPPPWLKPGLKPWLRPGSALPSPAYCFAAVLVWTENKNVIRAVFWGRQLKKTFLRKKVHPDDLARGLSDLEMTFNALVPQLEIWKKFLTKHTRKEEKKFCPFHCSISVHYGFINVQSIITCCTWNLKQAVI